MEVKKSSCAGVILFPTASRNRFSAATARFSSPENPSEKTVRQVADLLRAGGIIIYPTDGVYAYGCALSNPKGIDKLRAVSGKGSSDFSIVCADLSTVATYAKVSTPLFKLLKKIIL